MSEYQYYEFQAIDHPLTEQDQDYLRSLSTRARITANSFVNHYHWGSFSWDTTRLMVQMFDLHLHLNCWGDRQLMIRVPKRLMDHSWLEKMMIWSDSVKTIDGGNNIIINIHRCEEGSGYYSMEEEGPGWLAGLAPLRADLLAGVWQLPYLIWLMAVEAGDVDDDALEPLPGIGPLTGAIIAFAEFFMMDVDLVRAAAELPTEGTNKVQSPEFRRAVIASLAENRKTELLSRLIESDPYVTADLQRYVREAVLQKQTGPPPAARTAASLRLRAMEIRQELDAAEERRQAAIRQQEEQQAAQEQQRRIALLRQRKEADLWQEIEADAGSRTYSRYDRAALSLHDLRAMAAEDEKMREFNAKFNALVTRHCGKKQLILRLEDYHLAIPQAESSSLDSAAI